MKEGAIPGERDTLARGIEVRRNAACEGSAPRATADGIEVDRGFDHVGEVRRGDGRYQPSRRPGQTEMPLRQS
jgi:hypothetical protein